MNNTYPTRFDTLKRNYAAAVLAEKDPTPALLTLSRAVALSVVKKCIDPQGKTAAERDTVSDSGVNPAMVALKRDIIADYAAVIPDFETDPADPDLVGKIDPAALILGHTLGDGLDLVNTAAAAILEETAKAMERNDLTPDFLDTLYTVRRLDKRVYIRLEDSAAYKDVETCGIVEVYKTVRRAIQSSRAIQTDPRNGYTYLEDFASPDPADPAAALDTIYYRMDKYADLGGVDSSGNYTVDRETVNTVGALISRLNLTDRQATVLKLRMRGYGYKAIGSYLGVKRKNIVDTLKQIQAKCEKIGFTPAAVADIAE